MSELHAVQETRGSKCVSIWEKQSGGLFRSECSIAPPIRQPVSQCGRQIAAPTIMSWGPQKGFCLFGERRHYEMRAGWILLEIRHKQYEVNVDEVGADIIRPQIPQSAALTAPFTREPKKMREGDRRRRWRDYCRNQSHSPKQRRTP